jgi:hypothetical protein
VRRSIIFRVVFLALPDGPTSTPVSSQGISIESVCTETKPFGSAW